MRTSKQTGRAGEEAAGRYLEKKGFRVIASDYATSGGELDLVTYRRGALVFVEVKTRSCNAFGTPAEAVGDLKRRRLRAAAKGFWHEQQKYGRIPVWSRLRRNFVLRRVVSARLDIAEVYLEDGIVRKINIIENAEDYAWLIKHERNM
jgi:UPF0102 protein amet_2739